MTVSDSPEEPLFLSRDLSSLEEQGISREEVIGGHGLWHDE